MKKQTSSLSFLKSDLFFFSLLGICILICFLFLTPKVASTLFPQKRAMIWQSFISEVQKKQTLDPQKYWEFREFYSPGYFEFARDGLKPSQTQDTLRQIALPIQNNPTIIPFLVFHAKYLQSLDFLTTNSDNLSTKTTSLKKENILFQNKSVLIYQESPHTVKISFVLPESEMKKANGFFEYNSTDKEFVKDKYWLNITKVTLP